MVSIHKHILAGARGVMLPSQDMDTATRVQIRDEPDCISHSTNTLGKGVNPIILPPVGQSRFFRLCEATILAKGKL